MNKSLAFLFLLSFGIGSFTTAFAQPFRINEAIENGEPFDIKLQIEKVYHEQYVLSATIVLSSGSYVISPYSEDDFYGRFDISIANNEKVIPFGSLQEIPPAVEEFDPILEKPVKFVRVNTTYKQRIKVVAENDFEISGLIWFLYEPSCIPYDVEFMISYRSGVVEVKRTNTSISSDYKQ